MALLDVTGLCAGYGDVPVLRCVDLSISAGNLIAGLAARGFDASNPEAVLRLFVSVAAVCAIAGVALLALTPFLKRLMGGVR